MNDHRAPWRAPISGTASADSVSYDDHEECVVAMHIHPIKGTAQVTLKVDDGTEPTLSMPMLVANGHRLYIEERMRC